MDKSSDTIANYRQPEFPVDNSPQASMIRSLAAIVGLCLVVAGGYLTIQVFFEVGAVIRDPAGVGKTIEGFAQLIQADKLILSGGEGKPNVEPGRFIATFMLLIWFFIWAWIPIALLSAGGSVVGNTLNEMGGVRKILHELYLKKNAEK